MSGQDDRDNSSRLACGTVDNFGLSKDAIQIWLDVQQLINLGLTATYVRDVIEAQNRNIATGKLGQALAPEGRARSSTGWSRRSTWSSSWISSFCGADAYNKAELRTVEPGSTHDTKRVVTNGLKQGERAVVVWAKKVKSRSEVKPTQPAETVNWARWREARF